MSVNFYILRVVEMTLNRYRRKRPKVDASIFDSALSHTRRSDASKKKKKIACPLLAEFACGQVSRPRLYRLKPICLKLFSFIELPWIESNDCNILSLLLKS